MVKYDIVTVAAQKHQVETFCQGRGKYKSNSATFCVAYTITLTGHIPLLSRLEYLPQLGIPG